MNKVDRIRLVRFHALLIAVPFASIHGGSTGPVSGLRGFDQDMRAIRTGLSNVLQGMLLEKHPDMENGLDYDDPDILLTALEKWVEQRKSDGWQDANEFSFANFWHGFKESNPGLD